MATSHSARGCTLPPRVSVEIDLGALARNYGRIARRVAPLDVVCVLKANAYGLGVVPYAKTLAEAGCRDFGVAELREAFQLLDVFRRLPEGRRPRVQILSSVLPEEIAPALRAGVALPVCGIQEAAAISAAAAKLRRRARVHLKIDTGMGRLGIPAAQAEEAALRIAAMPGLDCEGIFSHCPVAYNPDDPFTARQIAAFADLVRRLRARGLRFRSVHIAASDAINNFPKAAKPPFTAVRTGINLHGSFDPNGRRALKVEPVLTLKTRVAQVRDLPAGTTLGYGRTWCLAAPSRIATISAGYADGLPMALANRGFVFIHGRRCPIVGRISMDYATVDVTGVPGVAAGDEVVCFGKCGRDSITPDDWAAIKGTHAYDILCGLGSRVVRRAVPAGKRQAAD